MVQKIIAVGKRPDITGSPKIGAYHAEQVIKALIKLQAFAQKAVVTALTSPQDCVVEMRRAFAGRAEFFFQVFFEILGLKPVRPQGTFCLFCDFSAYYGGKTRKGRAIKDIKDSVGLAECFLEEGKVATVPGIAFNEDRFLRISFTQHLKTLKGGDTKN